MQAGEDIVKDMARGPEAYLQMWERAYGVKPNACTNPTSKLSPATFASGCKAGMTELGDAERASASPTAGSARRSATARPAGP